MNDRTPLPNDAEAELAVLCCAMMSSTAAAATFEDLTEADFYVGAHADAFAAMRAVYVTGAPVDAATTAAEMRRRATLNSHEVDALLVRIMGAAESAASYSYHVATVRGLSVRRSIIEAAQQIAYEAAQPACDAQAVAGEAERLMMDATQRSARKGFERSHDVFSRALDRIEQMGVGVSSGTPTGFSGYDERTGGLHAGELVVIAARPSMGKTTLALNIARNVSRARKAVAVFSLEMNEEQLAECLMVAEARVDRTRLRHGTINREERAQVGEAILRLADAPLFIDDAPGTGILEMRARCRRLHASHGLDLVVVDYLQLVNHAGRIDQREQQIAQVSRNMKEMAKELEVPVIVLAQLNREVDKREDHMPRLSDLRESGSIEQDADVVALLTRPDRYRTDEATGSGGAEPATLVIAKQRNGPIGTVDLEFTGRYMQFRDAIQGPS